MKCVIVIYKVAHSKIEFVCQIHMSGVSIWYRSTQQPVLRGGKLHLSKCSSIKATRPLSEQLSASKVPCQWVVIERNGSYRLIRASITDDLGSSRGIISAQLFTFLMQRAQTWSTPHRVRELRHFRNTPVSIKVESRVLKEWRVQVKYRRDFECMFN